MANYNNYNSGLGWKILSLFLALIIVAGVITGVVFWQKGNIVFNPVEQEQPNDEEQQDDETDGGTVVNEGESVNVKVLSAKIATADYAEYGVSPLAETAYTLTATVLPSDDASNTKVSWSLKWANPESEWATDKAVTDYVTVTPSGDDVQASKQAVVANLQPFGEQIIVTATSEDDPTKFATCTVDYAQKLTDFSVKFGDVVCDFESGRTGVSVEVNPEGDPNGGAAVFEKTVGDVYSLADSYTVTYQLGTSETLPFSSYQFLSSYSENMAHTQTGCLVFASSSDNVNFDNSALTSYSVSEKGLYFGLQYFSDNLGLHYVSFGRGTYTVSDVFQFSTPATYINAFEYLNKTDDSNTSYDTPEMFDLTVTVTGTYSTMTKTTTFYMAGYTNLSTVTGVTLDEGEIIF